MCHCVIVCIFCICMSCLLSIDSLHCFTCHTGVTDICELKATCLTQTDRQNYRITDRSWRCTGHASQTTLVYPPTGSTAYEREMSTPSTLLRSMALLYLTLPRRCLTLSNPVPWQNWMVAYLGNTLRMKTLFRGWPVMVNDTHTRRRRRPYLTDRPTCFAQKQYPPASCNRRWVIIF